MKDNSKTKFIKSIVKGIKSGMNELLKGISPFYTVISCINDQLKSDYETGKNKNEISVEECEKYLLDHEQKYKYFVMSVIQICIEKMNWKDFYTIDIQKLASTYCKEYLKKYSKVITDEEYGILEKSLPSILEKTIKELRLEYEKQADVQVEIKQQIATDIYELQGDVKNLKDNIYDKDESEAYIVDNFSKNCTPIFGRKTEMKMLEKAFETSNIVFLSGIGGIGKSALAREYAEHQTYDIIVEVWGNRLNQIILGIGINGWKKKELIGLHEDDPKYTDIIVNKLSELRGNRIMLLIIHDYDTQELLGVDKLKRIGCDVLITSRCSWKGYTEVTLDPNGLSEKAAIDLFCYHSGMQSDEKEIAALVKYLEYHPLLIELVAKQMNFSEYNKTYPKEMLNELKKEGVKEHKYEKFHYSKDQRNIEIGDVYSHLTNIFSIALKNGNLDEKEIKILRNMILIGNQNIDYISFAEWSGLKREEYPVLDALVHKGWLIGEKGTFRMHLAICEAIYRLEEVQPTIENSKCFLEKFQYQKVRKLDTYEERIVIFRIAESIWKHLREEKNEKYIATLIWIGYTLYADNRYQSLSLIIYEKALEIKRQLPHEASESTAILYNDLGISYTNLGKLDQGLGYQKKALKIRREIFGELNEATARSYNNVGYSYAKLGNIQEALKYSRMALKIREELFGLLNEDTAASYNNVGGFLVDLGETELGLELLEKALDIRIKVLTEINEDTASSYNNVGKVYWDIGKKTEGIDYANKAYDIFRKILGEEHAQTVKIRRQLDLWNSQQDT